MKIMPYIPPSVVQEVKRMDLLTWVRLLYRKKEQVARKSQVCDLKIRTLDDADENRYLSGVPFLDVTQLKTTGSKVQRLGRGG